MRGGHECGFTLFELMLVIAIIGIAYAIAVPTFSAWRARSAVDNAAKTLLAHMKQARALAMAENRSVSITFSSNDYTFDAVPAGGSCDLCKNEVRKFSEFSSDLTMTPTTTRTFSSLGTVSQSGSVTIAAGGFSKQVTLNVIGRAYLQ